MGGVYLNAFAITIISNELNKNLNPLLFTNNLLTSSATPRQLILTYTTTSIFYLQGFSAYVWDTINSYQVFFGTCQLEVNGQILYMGQLTSMNGGSVQIPLSPALVFQPNTQIQITCSPSPPLNNQSWTANLIGAA